MNFKKLVKSIQTTGYNGANTLHIYIKKVVLGLFGKMVRHLKNTARVQMANTLGGQDVVIGNLLKKGVFMEELKDQVIFLLKERETAAYIF